MTWFMMNFSGKPILMHHDLSLTHTFFTFQLVVTCHFGLKTSHAELSIISKERPTEENLKETDSEKSLQLSFRTMPLIAMHFCFYAS